MNTHQLASTAPARALLLSACLAWSAVSQAQTESLALPAPDVQAALSADDALQGPRPYRFAVAIPVQVTPATHGRWQTLDDGRRQWRLSVTSEGAQTLNFAFTRFELPEGAQLAVSAPDGGDRRGPYSAQHATAGQLWTPPVHGSAAVIELTLPATSAAGLGLELTRVNYGFRGFSPKEADPKALPCNIDAACPEGDEWRNEIRAVARILAAGVFACSGTLLNNTVQDFRPYFLTANHCFDASGAEPPSTVVLWNFQKSKCGGEPNPASGGLLGDNSGNNQTGATMRANGIYRSPVVPFAMSAQADFALLELSQKPPPEFKVYYAGWDRRDLAPVGVIGFHHPSAQEKSISLTSAATSIGDIEGSPDAALGSFNYFLNLNGWERGTTQSGSSGSGSWNMEHRLVGSLTGGQPQESCPHTGSVSYFRFYSAWHFSELPMRTMPPFLDPLSSGVEVLDGADPNGLDLRPPAKLAESRAAAQFGGTLSLGLLCGGLALAGIRRQRERRRPCTISRSAQGPALGTDLFN